MHKEELLKQLHDVMDNGADIKKVKITYKNGEVMKIAFDDDDDEGDDDEGEGEDDEEEDDEEEEDDDEDEDVAVDDKAKTTDAIQESGWKVNVNGQ